MLREAKVRGSLHSYCAQTIAAICLLSWSCTPFKDNPSRVRDAGEPPDASDLVGDCAEDSDCPPSGPCTDVRCDKGACIIRSTRDGVALADNQQVEGDCAQLVCDGRGGFRSENDDSDVRSDGNPCHDVRCVNGVRQVTDMPDESTCNDTGVCQGGACSICSAGLDCSRPSDCTIRRSICPDGNFVCEDTGIPRMDRSCEPGKVCHEGSCVPCVVGAPCDPETPCSTGLITDCKDGIRCEPQPVSGAECGQDPTGRTMFCVSGRCTTPCMEGPCMTASNACQTSHWDCTSSEDEPVCVPVPKAEGSECGDGSVCRSGNCVARALVNGDFSRGLEGWQTSGDGANFKIMPDPQYYGRPTLFTGAANSGAGRGTVSQSFTVPPDATALRFVVSGGRAHVRLKDASGAVIEDCTGLESTEAHVPVNWELEARRGQKLTISIDDDLGSGEWAYVAVSGFDVLRAIDGSLRNSQWTEAFKYWETTGDGLYFNVFRDQNNISSDAWGHRLSLSTYARDSAAAATGSASRGTVSQSFLVPTDAVALRFALHGGRAARVRLLDGNTELYRATGRDSDVTKIPVSWDLESMRGMTVRLTIEDDQASGLYGYVGTSGFDLITAYNGP